MRIFYKKNSKKIIKFNLFLFYLIILFKLNLAHAETINHIVRYPSGAGPFPVVIVLHTSGGFQTVLHQIPKFTRAGYAVYAPDFFKRHGLTKRNRFETWTTYRAQIEVELIELLQLAKSDPKADANNIFAVGFSNGGYWASFLAARKHVNAAASHYGVWRWPSSSGWDGYPVKYFETDSHPVLALHGDRDSIQKPSFVYPQLEAAKARSRLFSQHIFSDAGHSWDCERCPQDGFDRAVSQKALEMTLDFFAENRR